MDSISILQFITPLIMAIIFSLLTIMPKDKDKPSNTFSGGMVSILSSIIASISWFIFGLTWPAVATQEMFVSVAYLWYAIGAIFAIFALYIGMKMLGAIFETDSEKPLVLKIKDEVD